ncbi:hypothetical protein KEM52_000384 [Ascosphaera acerosa]|nr:hypothetical protein KEM52_000384 [Ascosphaera acerosa]
MASKTTLHVANLHPTVTPAVLTSAFIPFGPIASVHLPQADQPAQSQPQPPPPPPPQDQPQQRLDPGAAAAPPASHRGWGYVEFESEADAREAVDNMDGSELYGKFLRVSHARTKEREGGTKEGLGSKVAIWQQEGYLAEHALSDEDKQALEAGGDATGAERGAGAAAAAAAAAADDNPLRALEEMDIAGPKLKPE